MDGYQTTKQAASKQHSDWLNAIVARAQESERTRLAPPHDRVFAGSWVKAKLGASPRVRDLRPLVNWSILDKVETSRGGDRAYHRLPDEEGMRRALVDLGCRV